MTKYLGNSLQTTRYRILKSYKKNGKTEHMLISWIDRHCSKCGRFLKKNTPRKICHICAEKNWKEKEKEYYRNYMKEYRKKLRAFQHTVPYLPYAI